MPTNDIKVNDVVSKEIIRLFEYNFISGATMDRQYDATKSHRGAAEGSQIRIKQPQRFIATDGAAINIQNTVEEEVVLTRTTQKHVALGFTSQELSQDLLDDGKMAMFSKEYLDEAICTLASAVDADILNRARLASYNTLGTPGSNPNTYADVTNMKATLNKYGAPKKDRFGILTDDAMSSLNAGTQNLFNPKEEKSQDYRDGELANVNGIKFWNSDFLGRHANGDGDASAATVQTTATEGESTVDLTGLTGTTITAGSTIWFADVRRRNYKTKAGKADIQKFTVTANATITTGAATVSISPALVSDPTNAYAEIDSLPQAGAAVTIEGDPSEVYDQSLVYSRQAFVFATQDLAKIDAVREFAVRDEELGVSMKFTSQGDINNLAARSRVDILYGFAAVCPWWSIKIWGA
jgi:hypothetical protein